MQMDKLDCPSLSCCKFSVDESGKSRMKLEGKSGKIIFTGRCYPPKFWETGRRGLIQTKPNPGAWQSYDGADMPEVTRTASTVPPSQ